MHMVQDVRSSSQGGAVFDLLTQEGVMQALGLVRASDLSVGEKRELRDLIFSYTNTGGDPALRNLLDSRLQDLKIVATELSSNPKINESQTAILEAIPVELADRPTTVIGSTRPVPNFKPVTAQSVSLPNPVNLPDISIANSTPAQTPSVSIDVPVIKKIEVRTTAPIVDGNNQFIQDPSVPPAPVLSESPAAVAAVEPVVGKAVVENTSNLDVHKDRINEIKQIINSQIGNPINLLDIDGTIGRSYMAALLDAMKIVSGGQGDVDESMAKLEKVFVQVESLIESKTRSTVIPQKTTDQINFATPADTQSQPMTVLPNVSNQTEISSVRISPNPPIIPDIAKPLVPISPMDIDTNRSVSPKAVSEADPLRSPTDLPSAQELKAQSGITDPLFDTEVDAGLEQLLSEWSLFKKSGMFGSGPKCKQHPLFVKIAGLQMPIIISGRFEGATTEVRQSIADYMNGWRYEQGIIYQDAETFETYLRRVIRHIIDLQTKRRGS